MSEGMGLSVPRSRLGGEFAVSSRHHPNPPPGVAVREFAFRLPDLPELRDFAAAQAHRIGMTEDAVSDLVLAVNEVATNAVTHGTLKAHLRIWVDGGDLIVEIHDDGTAWLPSESLGLATPGPHATSGMGLWVARRLAADLTLRTGQDGSTVTMRFAGRV